MKKIFLFLIFSFSIYIAKSQKSELGAFIGTSYYIGELTNSYFANPKSAAGVIYRYNLNPRWALKASAFFGSFEASDKETNSNNPRNLSFRSPISEISAQMEFNFLKLYIDEDKNRFTPYIFGGISVFSFNPQTQYDNHWYDLQPIGTEGQGLEGFDDTYSLTSVSIPFGLGIKFNFFRRFSTGLEWGWRKTFTDYIDDVSTKYVNPLILTDNRPEIIAYLADRSTEPHQPGTARGVANNKDWYGFAGFWLSFKITDDDAGCPSYMKSKIRTKSTKKR